MTLIKSVSGIRGTIGGRPQQNLTPIDIVIFTSAFATLSKQKFPNTQLKIVLGRDARPTGEMISSLVKNTLIGMGVDIIDLGLSTTPTVEMAVIWEKAHGGIILTASHNPIQWNALKLLNEKGEFISAKAGEQLLKLIETNDFQYATYDSLGKSQTNTQYIIKHVEAICALPFVDVEKIKNANYRVVVDAVNSTGGIAIPILLNALGVETVALYCTPNGDFPHNPEPLEKHLGEIMRTVPKEKADLGIVVDPDVDRLALISEDGKMFGEEYTLVAIAQYILQKKKGPVVSNLSSSLALKNIADNHNVEYHASAVGEVHVVSKMKECNAILGGEGNGGIILPELHYGRDALVGIALFLSYMADSKKSCSEIKSTLPLYHMSKQKMNRPQNLDMKYLEALLQSKYPTAEINTIDGIKLVFKEKWIHLRKSNTENIIRIYTEAPSQREANTLASDIIKFLESKFSSLLCKK